MLSLLRAPAPCYYAALELYTGDAYLVADAMKEKLVCAGGFVRVENQGA